MKIRYYKSILLMFLFVSCVGCKGDSYLFFYPVGEVVPNEWIAKHGYKGFFKANTIPDSIFQIMKGKSFKDDCTIPRDSLRYITCLHRNLQGEAIVGEMVVNARIAEKVLDIFLKLYEQSYPIERMRLIDYWDADDERSMCDNNSSCFNFRFISHTDQVSKHGLGIAVDINPLYNPYHKILEDGTELIEPLIGKPYLKRDSIFPYKIEKGDLCYTLFLSHGFQWGGECLENRVDYQHFELP